MIIETEEKDLQHPKGKIRLISGAVLECYPIADEPSKIERDELKLDLTGVYLRTSKKPRKGLTCKTGKEQPVREPWEDLFLKNAFFLYEHRDVILSDSRMFLTPLPFRNGLAYTGTSGLNKATLGVYLEWWDNCERAIIKHEGEAFALTYHIAGSPLSGSNRCSAVDRDGRSFTIQFESPFTPLWSSFMKINQRYTEAKQIYQAYTLEETLAKLRGI